MNVISLNLGMNVGQGVKAIKADRDMVDFKNIGRKLFGWFSFFNLCKQFFFRNDFVGHNLP